MDGHGLTRHVASCSYLTTASRYTVWCPKDKRWCWIKRCPIFFGWALEIQIIGHDLLHLAAVGQWLFSWQPSRWLDEPEFPKNLVWLARWSLSERTTCHRTVIGCKCPRVCLVLHSCQSVVYWCPMEGDLQCGVSCLLGATFLSRWDLWKEGGDAVAMAVLMLANMTVFVGTFHEPELFDQPMLSEAHRSRSPEMVGTVQRPPFIAARCLCFTSKIPRRHGVTDGPQILVTDSWS